MYDHATYLSPLTWRYGSAALRTLWSQTYQRRLWRRVWVALAEAQAEAGLVTAEQAADLRGQMDALDLERAQALEVETRHDLVAELRTFAEQCPVGGAILHLGATSADIQDNADALRLREALDLILGGLHDLLGALAARIEAEADTVCMAFTHLQPAEPTTLGYRLALYGQDLLLDWGELGRVRGMIRGKGIKGAVGTAASYAALLHGSTWSPARLEQAVMARLGLNSFAVAGQTYPRKQDWLVINALAGLAGSLYKLMFDLRVLQSPPVGEWSEPFGAQQVGSSAMPFKRNPVAAEKIDSLARWVAGLPRVAWDNAAHSLLERTLDDSANRRLLLPEAFLAVDEIVRSSHSVIRDGRFNQAAVARNLAAYGAFAAVEPLLMALGRAGADRQAMHERLRVHSMRAWEAVMIGDANPLADLIAGDEAITRYLEPAAIRAAMDARAHVGNAPERARALAADIRRALDRDPD
ncbi:MAG: adenylosuccinate lyase [Chloroflexi bacterium]|nr:adenylosuccinate lyase [Chloroflexota bacterium]